MNGGQQQQQASATSANKDSAGAGANAPTTRPGLKTQSQDPKASVQAQGQTQAQATSTPSMTGAVGAAPANGGGNNNAASATTTSAATAAINKKRKKEGLKPIITTEYVLQVSSLPLRDCRPDITCFCNPSMLVLSSFLSHCIVSHRIAHTSSLHITGIPSLPNVGCAFLVW